MCTRTHTSFRHKAGAGVGIGSAYKPAFVGDANGANTRDLVFHGIAARGSPPLTRCRDGATAIAVVQTGCIGGNEAVVGDRCDRTRCGRVHKDVCKPCSTLRARSRDLVVGDRQGRTKVGGVAQSNTMLAGIGNVVVRNGERADRVTDLADTVYTGVFDDVAIDRYRRGRAQTAELQRALQDVVFDADVLRGITHSKGQGLDVVR